MRRRHAARAGCGRASATASEAARLVKASQAARFAYGDDTFAGWAAHRAMSNFAPSALRRFCVARRKMPPKAISKSRM